MKKKLTILFSLLFLLIPVVGCNKDDNSNKIEIKVELATTDGPKAANVKDCARVSGSGFYNEGEKVSIKVEYNTNACVFKGWTHEDTSISTANGFSFTASKDAGGTYRAMIEAKGQEASNSFNVKFTGITLIGSDSVPSETITPQSKRITFPVKTEDAEATVSEEVKTYTKSTEKATLEKVFSVISGNKNVDLNYAYIDGKLNPVKLEWRVRNLLDSNAGGICESTYESIDDISATELTKDSCIYALINPVNPENTPNNDIDSGSKLKNFLDKAGMFVTTSSKGVDTSCQLLEGTGKENDECIYVRGLANLVDPLNKPDTDNGEAPVYYGYRSDGTYEGLSFSVKKDIIYKLCNTKIDYENDKCSLYYQVDNYNYNSSDTLSKTAADFFNGYKNANVITVNEWDYSIYRQDIVPVSLTINDSTNGSTTTTYYIKIVTKDDYKDNKYKSNPSVKIKFNGNFQKSKIVEFSSTDTNFINTLNGNINNRIIEITGSDKDPDLTNDKIANMIREKLYRKKVEDKSVDLTKYLEVSYKEEEVDGKKVAKATIEVNDLDTYTAEEGYALVSAKVGNKDVICHVSDTACLTNTMVLSNEMLSLLKIVTGKGKEDDKALSAIKNNLCDISVVTEDKDGVVVVTTKIIYGVACGTALSYSYKKGTGEPTTIQLNHGTATIDLLKPTTVPSLAVESVSIEIEGLLKMEIKATDSKNIALTIGNKTQQPITATGQILEAYEIATTKTILNSGDYYAFKYNGAYYYGTKNPKSGVIELKVGDYTYIVNLGQNNTTSE